MTAACEERGWWEDMLVVFWSDHGEMLGDHGRVYKNVFYESSVRVPLILRWPGRIPKGTVFRALAQQVDVFPTLTEAAGAPSGGRCLGVSLWPVLEGERDAVRDAVLSEHANFGKSERNYMLRTERYKYAVDRKGRPYMLFDLEEDPGEQVNLVWKPGMEALEKEMRDRLFRMLTDTQPSLGEGPG